MGLRTTFLWTMIVSLSTAALLGIAAILFDGLGRTAERVILTSLLVGAFSITGLMAAIVVDRRVLVPLAWTGIGASMLAFTGWLLLVWMSWGSWNTEEAIAKVSACITYVAVWSPHLGLISLLRLDQAAGRTARRATMAIATLLLLLVTILTITEYDDDWFIKVTSIVGILTACGTVVTPILSLVDLLRRRSADTTLSSKVRVRLTCPRCGLASVLPTGGAKCPGCHLRIDVTVVEPRCACGYALYELRSDTCPECGRAVPETDRWHPPRAEDEPEGS